MISLKLWSIYSLKEHIIVTATDSIYVALLRVPSLSVSLVMLTKYIFWIPRACLVKNQAADYLNEI